MCVCRDVRGSSQIVKQEPCTKSALNGTRSVNIYYLIKRNKIILAALFGGGCQHVWLVYDLGRYFFSPPSSQLKAHHCNSSFSFWNMTIKVDWSSDSCLQQNTTLSKQCFNAFFSSMETKQKLLSLAGTALCLSCSSAKIINHQREEAGTLSFQLLRSKHHVKHAPKWVSQYLHR